MTAGDGPETGGLPFFNGGIAFHQGDLGGRSHGCVRLSRSSAQAFYGALRPGDVVQVRR